MYWKLYKNIRHDYFIVIYSVRSPRSDQHKDIVPRQGSLDEYVFTNLGISDEYRIEGTDSYNQKGMYK